RVPRRRAREHCAKTESLRAVESVGDIESRHRGGDAPVDVIAANCEEYGRDGVLIGGVLCAQQYFAVPPGRHLTRCLSGNRESVKAQAWFVGERARSDTAGPAQGLRVAVAGSEFISHKEDVDHESNALV